MTLDEAIKFEELIVESCESTARLCAFNDPYEPDVVFENNKCAEKHKQIAEWLIELKRLKEQEPVLDNIKEEIEQSYCTVNNDYDRGRNYGLYMATMIIDKCKAESED